MTKNTLITMGIGTILIAGAAALINDPTLDKQSNSKTADSALELGLKDGGVKEITLTNDSGKGLRYIVIKDGVEIVNIKAESSEKIIYTLAQKETWNDTDNIVTHLTYE